MDDGVGEVFRLSRAAAAALAVAGQRRVQRSEHTVPVAIVGIDLDGLFRRGTGVAGAVLPQIQFGEIRGDVGAARIGRERTLVGGNRAFDVVAALEQVRAKELLVCFGDPIRR